MGWEKLLTREVVLLDIVAMGGVVVDGGDTRPILIQDRGSSGAPGSAK